LRRKASKSGDGYTVDATKNIVPAGDQADAFIVPAQLDGKIALFLVENGREGVSTTPYATQDEGRAADLVCRSAAATLITTNGVAALTLAQDVANAALCAEGVGVMEQTLKLTTEYMNQRKQFGVVISSFQALRHRVADMKMQLELARSMSYYGTLKLVAPAEAPCRHRPRQGAAGPVHALCGPAGRAAAWRHRRDGRICGQPLLQAPDPDGDDGWRHPAPPGHGIGPYAGQRRRLCLKACINIHQNHGNCIQPKTKSQQHASACCFASCMHYGPYRSSYDSCAIHKNQRRHA
jgi:hypothetical protein